MRRFRCLFFGDRQFHGPLLASNRFESILLAAESIKLVLFNAKIDLFFTTKVDVQWIFPFRSFPELEVLELGLLSGRQGWLVGRWFVLEVTVRVKVRGVQWILDARDPRRRDLLAQELVDVDDAEPHVVAHVHVAPRETPQTVGLPPNDQSLDQILRQVVDETTVGEAVLDLDDALEETHLVGAVRVKRRATHQHFVNQYPERPIVHALVVTLRQNDFRRQILGSATQRVGLVDHNFGKPQIHQHAVPSLIDEDVLRLQVAVTNAALVQVGQRLEDARGVEARVAVRDAIAGFRVDDREQLSTLHQLNQHVQVALVLERCHQVDHERVVQRGHDVLFANHTLHLMMADDFALAELLQCVRFAAALVSDQPHLPEGTDTEDAVLDQILESDGRRVEIGSTGRQRRTEALDAANDTLNVFLGQDAAGGLRLHGDSLLAGKSVVVLQGLVAKVVGITEVVDHTVVVGHRHRTRPDDVQVLVGRLALLGEDGAGGEGHFDNEVSETGQFVGLELGIGEDGHAQQGALAHRRVDEALERSQHLFKGVARQAQARATASRRNVGHARIAGDQGPLPEKIAWTQRLIDVRRIPKANVVDLDRALANDVKDFTDISLVDDALPFGKGDRRQGVRDAEQIAVIQVGQKRDLAQHVVDVLLLGARVVGQHVAESLLIDLPKAAHGVGETGSGTGAVVCRTIEHNKATSR